MTAIAPTESRVLSGLPIPDAVHYPDTGFRRDTYAVRLFEAHGYDTGGQPFYSVETVRSIVASLYANVYLDFDQVGRAGPFTLDADTVHVPAVTVLDLVSKVPPAAPQVPEGWAPTDEQYRQWCETHDLPASVSREAFDDAVSLYLLATPPASSPQVPEGWREFIESCADMRGKMVDGNRLSMRAADLLATPPASSPQVPEGVAFNADLAEAALRKLEAICPVVPPEAAAIRSLIAHARASSPQVPDGFVAIDRGALKLAENVLRRAGKDEVADALIGATPPAPEQPGSDIARRVMRADEIQRRTGCSIATAVELARAGERQPAPEQPKPEPKMSKSARARHIKALKAIGSTFAGIPSPCDERDAINAAIAAMKAEQPKPAGDVEALAEWLEREMPAGTVIGDPRWWAVRIARRLSAKPAGDVEALLERYREWIQAIPVGTEDKQRGASAYNWHMTALYQLRRLAAQPAQGEGES